MSEQQQSDENRIQPRTLRLIKLISSNTTSDHTREAIILLSTTAAHSSPTVLWDIIYRLYSSLINPEDDSKGSCCITRRENIALAMEYVAKYIPKSDRDHFLYDTNDSIYSNEKDRNRFLTVQSLFETVGGETTLQRVLREGQLLLSCDESKYNPDNHVHDDNDLILTKQLVSMKSRNAPISQIVEERVKLQRSILAYRMGIGGLESCLKIEDFTPDVHSLISEKESIFEAAYSKQEYENDNSKKSFLSARERSKERLIKRRKTDKGSNDQVESMEFSDDPSPTRTLLLESLQDHSNTVSSRSLSQKDPQTILAADLMFHSFNAHWRIRHGSLLGLLALLKSWHSKSQQDQRSVKMNSSRQLGRWPQDILTRCLCIIGLDRFNDFSGLTFERIHQVVDSRNIDIAPVRDTAAQIISFLFVNNIGIQDNCIKALMELVNYEQHWEVRQGSILTLKWILSISSSAVQIKPPEWFVDLINQGLNDNSDDVRSSTAQLLSSFMSLNHESPENRKLIIQSTSASLWFAMGHKQVSAGNTMSILHTFADCIRYDYLLVLESIGCDLSEVMRGMCNFLKSPSESILLCCLEILPFITNAIKSAEDFSSVSIQAQFSMVEDLFHFYTNAIGVHDTEVTKTSDEESFSRALDSTWKSLISSLKYAITESHLVNIRRLVRSLLGKLCGLDGLSQPVSYAIDSKLGWTYAAVERSSSAFTLFLKTISQVLPESKHLVISMIISLINAPWYEDCELGFVLFRNYISKMKPSKPDLDIFSRLVRNILDSGPICLVSSETFCRQANTILRDDCRSILKTTLLSSNTNGPVSLSDAIAKSHAISEGWSRVISSNEQDSSNEVGIQVSISVTSMRLSASIAQVFSVLGHPYMPSKMTPLVRSIVTHLKNEECKERLDVTSIAAVSLIKSLRRSEDTFHNKVAGKMMKSICRLVGIDSVKSGLCTSQGSDCAIFIIQGLVRALEFTESFDSLEEIWHIILPLLQDRPHALEEKSCKEALSMLSIVSKYVRKGSSSFLQLSSMFLSVVTDLACSSGCILIRNDAMSILKNFCYVDTIMSFPIIMRHASQYLNTEDDPNRLGSAVLLNELVKTSAISICPFIRTLLPIVMSMMVDIVKEIADLSANTFSRLIYLSPLVPENSKRIDIDLGQWNKKTSDDVIDHLIHGKPLPACVYPDRLQKCIENNGIQLRNYQIDGISWLKFLQDVKLHGALCDDMGLGKTIQSLFAIVIAHEEKLKINPKNKCRSLVICPSSVTGQWINEIKKTGIEEDSNFALHYSGPNRSNIWRSKFDRCQIVVTSYTTLRSDIDLLKQHQWEYCVLDEGHLLKNPKTKTAKAARQLKANHKLILSGTPVQNKAHELWAIFDFLMPNYLGTEDEFSKRYERVIKRSHLPGASGRDIHEATNALKQLHQQVLPFILRREKEQVLKELPKKLFTDIPCAMTPLQRSLYDTFFSQKKVREATSIIDIMVDHDLENNADVKDDAKNIGKDILQAITHLRLICTHPLLVKCHSETDIGSLDTYAVSGKLQALNDILRRAGIYDDEVTGADNDESLLYIEHCGSQSQDLGERIVLQDDNDFESQDDEAIDTNVTSPPPKCLIFAQFNKSLDIVESLLLKSCMPSLRYFRLDGSTSSQEREEIIEDFQNNDDVRCLLLNTKVGSLGLNLQSANIVIFLEHDWNPFIDEQALSRAHRLGQERPVQIFRLITENSIEEKILKVQQKKIELSRSIVTTENSSFCSMGTDRLLDIFYTEG
jgi:TATA-binding protein-associated factor